MLQFLEYVLAIQQFAAARLLQTHGDLAAQLTKRFFPLFQQTQSFANDFAS